MSSEDLLEQSQATKSDANTLLQDLNLMEYLSSFGTVKLVGGYALDLMLVNDIDIHVIGTFDRKRALEVLNGILIEGAPLVGGTLNDFVIRSHECFPTGYYVGLKAILSNAFWKIDIWLLSPKNEPKTDYQAFVSENLCPDRRLAILRLKKYRNEHLPRVSSVHIYEAVLRHEVRTIKAFKEYLAANEQMK